MISCIMAEHIPNSFKNLIVISYLITHMTYYWNVDIIHTYLISLLGFVLGINSSGSFKPTHFVHKMEINQEKE